MKTLYIDCGMGCAGDMLTAALLELHPDREAFIAKMNAALGGRAVITARADSKCGIKGTHVSVLINGDEEGAVLCHEHEPTSIAEILGFIAAAPLPDEVRSDAAAVYKMLADAESRVHSTPVENIHFHEVGSIDALADVLNVCMLMHELAPEKVICSPISVGSGSVHCAHGVIPVPAPSTEVLLRGIPYHSGDIESELCTPTGAALLRHFADAFAAMPLMTVEAAGYGTGTKDFKRANVVRVLLGETQDECESVIELVCSIDDMTAEDLGFALERLLEAGALDAYYTSAGMKKCRPGVELNCICKVSERDAVLKCIFKNTSTLGVRERECRRYTLDRSTKTVETTLGSVSVKISQGYGVRHEKPEYDELAQIARKTGLSMSEIREIVNKFK